jgi:hypothetical protein
MLTIGFQTILNLILYRDNTSNRCSQPDIKKSCIMKRYLILLFIGIFCMSSFISMGQATLTFRTDNPRVLKHNGKQYFMFDVYIIASTSGTYLYATQLVFATTGTFVNTPSTNIYTDITGGILDGNYGSYSRYTVNTVAWNTTYAAIPISTNSNQSGIVAENVCALVSSVQYQKIITIGFEISVTTASSGITWFATLMKNQQKYLLSGELIGGASHLYGTGGVNNYYSNDFANVYVARVYSSVNSAGATNGWSQYGGTADDALYTDWTAIVNSSVWDTIPAGGTATISTTNSQANNLRVHAGAKLKIVPGGELKVTGTTEITEPRSLWIASTSAGISGSGSWIDNGEGSITYNGSASIRVERYIGQSKWHIIGFPKHTVYAQATFLDTYLKWYDETRTVGDAFAIKKYRYVINPLGQADSALTGDLRGWYIWSDPATTGDWTARYTATSSSHLVSGALTRTLTRTAFNPVVTYPFDGWNMVANMYPSPIDWDTPSGNGWTRTNVDPTIYMWSQSVGNYAQYTYNGSGTGASVNGGTRYIPSMQGFFVHTTTNGTTFGMDNTVRTFSSQAFWKGEVAYNDLLDMKVAGNGYSDEAKVWFNPQATVNFEPEFDTYKLSGLAQAPQLYCLLVDNNYAAINSLPWGGLNTLVPVEFALRDSLNPTVTVTITASNMESFRSGTRIYLEDKKEATTQELTVNPVYTFTSSLSDAANRFVLHFYNPSYGIEDKSLAGMQIYSFEKYGYIRNLESGTTKGIVQIYDLLGRKVFETNLKDVVLNKFLPGINEGYYMVRVVTPENVYTQKIYLK